MKRTICVINGKDSTKINALIDSIASVENTFVYDCSFLEPFKEICSQFNESGKEDFEYKKFLLGMKTLVDDYCFKTNLISRSQEYLKGKLKEFMLYSHNLEERDKDVWDAMKTKHAVMFVYIRDPYDIDEFVDRTRRELAAMKDIDTKVTTLFVQNIETIESHAYDFTYTYNDNTLEDAKFFREFFFDTLENKEYEFYDDVRYDYYRDDVVVGRTNTGGELHVSYDVSTSRGTHQTATTVSVPQPYAVDENGRAGIYVNKEIIRKVINTVLVKSPELERNTKNERKNIERD